MMKKSGIAMMGMAIIACFLLLPQAVYSQTPASPAGPTEPPVVVEIMPAADDITEFVQQKKEPPKKESPKKESPKKEPPKKEPPRKEPPKESSGPPEKKAPEFMPAPKLAAAPLNHLDGKILVFAVDGSGDWDHLYLNLRELAQECRLPICVERVKWSRFAEACKDHIDHEAQLGAGLHLARCISAIRHGAPRAYIFLVGHSAGARVVLAAAEAVPPGAVDRVFLLAPSVSCSYDLRGALRGSRGGIVSYFSREDVLLEQAEETLGTADGLRTPTAGRVGFSVPPPIPTNKAPPDAALYRGLRQVMWRDDAQMGHGNHYGWVHQQFLRAHLLPQFFTLQACH